MEHAAPVSTGSGDALTPSNATTVPSTRLIPATPGKVAMWLFLATEIMFFTGLIGSYVVLRAGSPVRAYSAQYSPNTPTTEMADPDAVRFANWPKPFDDSMNPLNVPMTAANTFILMLSSVTLSIGMMNIQKGRVDRYKLWMVLTVILGSTFLGVQVYEYYALIFEHHFPIGVSKTGHFTPDVSLFASCFYTMTGFHGAHVAGGVVALSICTIGSFLGWYGQRRHAPVEYVGLYWHFVDLVWIVLFTVVYLI